MSKNRDTVSYEAVAKAMAEITAAGEKPTVRRVQVEVGGGSHTTLLAHIKRYNDEQRAALAAGPAAGILTPEVSAALVGWVKQREDGARQDADQRVAEVDELYRAAKEGWEKADTRIEDLEGELEAAGKKAAEEVQALKSETAALQTRIQGADKQLAELKEHLLREQHSSEASRLAAAEARIKADAAQESIKTLGRANEELLGESRAQGKALSEAQQQAAVAEERAKNREEQLVEVRARASAAEQGLQQRLNQAEGAAKAVSAQLAEAQKGVHENQQAAQVLQVRLSESEARAHSGAEQLAQARAEAEAQAKGARALQGRLETCQKELSAAERDLAICREQHKGGGGGQGGGSGPGPGSDERRDDEPQDRRPGKAQDGGKQQASPTANGQRMDDSDSRSRGESREERRSHDEGESEGGVNVTMRKLGKPATQEEVRRSMQALMTGAPKLGHQLFRGEAPKTHTREASGGVPGATEQARP